MPTATEEGLTIMHKMVESGEVKDGAEAYTLLHKRHPDLVQRAAQERAPRPPPVRKAPPLDYSQRQALAKQDFPLTVPAATSGYADFLAMVDAMLRQHPGMAEDAARVAVMAQDGGRQAFERHRQQLLFGQPRVR